MNRIMSKRIAIVLAAGESKRMYTEVPKVLHEICGMPLLSCVFDACRKVGVEKIFAVVGYGKDEIMARFTGHSDIVFVEQKEQKGTAHAVMCCKEHISDMKGDAMILHGDVPLILPETLKTILDKHDQEMAAATLGTAVLEDPTGYGRVIRDSYGNIQGIVEEADCTEEQRKIKEMNPAFYCFDIPVLVDVLDKVRPDNAQGEYYLPDALRLTIATGHKVVAVTAVSHDEALGVNTRAQLSEVGKIMQMRIQSRLMENGVTIVDPDNAWIDVRAEIGQDTVIEPFTYISGAVKVGRNCRIGPFAYLSDGTVVGPGETVDRFGKDEAIYD